MRERLRTKAMVEARKRVAAGESCYSIARSFNVTVTTIRRWTDPEYLEHRKRRINECRRARQASP